MLPPRQADQAAHLTLTSLALTLTLTLALALTLTLTRTLARPPKPPVVPPWMKEKGDVAAPTPPSGSGAFDVWVLHTPNPYPYSYP